jgi:hypothetical protein
MNSFVYEGIYELGDQWHFKPSYKGCLCLEVRQACDNQLYKIIPLPSDPVSSLLAYRFDLNYAYSVTNGTRILLTDSYHFKLLT